MLQNGGSYTQHLGFGSRTHPLDIDMYMARLAAKGYASKEEVYKPKQGFVIHEADTKPEDQIGGQGYKLGGCHASYEGFCRKGLGDGVERTLNQILGYLNKLCDRLTKSVVAKAETLLMFECEVGGVVLRKFAFLVWASFSPKFQLFAMCECAERNAIANDAEQLVYPFEVDIVFEQCKVTSSGEAMTTRTSGQLALMLADLGQVWLVPELKYQVPDRESLVPSEVMGIAKGPDQVSGDGIPVATRRQPLSTDPIAQQLRRRFRGDPVEVGQQAAMTARDNSTRRLASLVAPPPLQDAPALVDDVDPECIAEHDMLCESAELLDEVLEAAAEPEGGELDIGCDEPEALVGDDAAPVGAEPLQTALEGAVGGDVASEPAEAPQSPPLAPLPIVGPDSGGYFKRGGKIVGRLTAAFGKSRAIRCYEHSRCSLAISMHKVPSNDQIIQWLSQAEPAERLDPKPEAERKRDAHLQLLRDIRDATP